MYQLVIVAAILCFLFKVLNVNNSPEKSLFFCSNAKFLEDILRHAPSLSEPYSPTRLWGFSGHVQTIIQCVLSRIICPLVDGRRYSFVLSDGATVTYDLYHAIEPHPTYQDYTLALCPGLCNSSESVYIRRVVYQAQFQGYRVAVLNHVGVLKNVPVTSPRIFGYGNTDDYAGMIQDLSRRYPGTKFICVGFSMGGNLVTKYLGEVRSDRPDDKIVAGVSACQGYDAVLASKLLLQWENGRRLYLFCMTENLRSILRRWQKELFPEQLKRDRGIVEREIWSAATAVELDEVYTRKIGNFETVQDFYQHNSCANYFNGIKVPMVFINAADDPIVPKPLLEIVKDATKKRDNFLYIEQKYGGHLGFYEGGFIYPNAQTWLDKNVVNLADALVHYSSGKDKLTESDLEEEEKLFMALAEAEFTLKGQKEKELDQTQQAKNRPRYVCKKKTKKLRLKVAL